MLNVNIRQVFPNEEMCSHILKALHLDQGVKYKIAEAVKNKHALDIVNIISNIAYEAVCCPRGCQGKVYKLKCKGHNYKCRNCRSKKKFNEKTNTIFQGMQMDLCQGIMLAFFNDLDIDFTDVELSKAIGVSTKTVSKFIRKIDFINGYSTFKNDDERKRESVKLDLDDLDIGYNKQLLTRIIQCCRSNPDLLNLEKLLKGDIYSFITYPGSKRALVVYLISKFPKKFNNYFEPFVGGGSLFFAINRAGILDGNSKRKFYISDYSGKLIDVYQDIKNSPNDICKHLTEYKSAFDMTDDKSGFFDELKADYNNLAITGVKRSATLIFLAKTCYHGAFSFTSKGNFKGSYGKDKFNFDPENIARCSKALNGNVVISSCSFEDIEHLLQPGDFVYLDPPYFSYKKDMIGYGSDLTTREGQIRIRDFLLRLHKKGVFFMMSNYYTPFLINELYNDKVIFNIETVKVTRSISGINCTEDEIIVRNYK